MKLFLILAITAISTAVFCQKADEPISPHYLFPEFTKAYVKMKNGKINEARMNYNMITQEMVFDQNGKLLALANILYVDTVIISNRKFIPYGKSFYEVLYRDSIPLFVQHAKKISPAGKPAGYGGTTQTSAVTSVNNWMSNGGVYELKLPQDYTLSDATLYWTIINNDWKSFISERQLLNIFPEWKTELKKYIQDNHLNLKKEEDVVKLMMKINQF